jgi:hypothetical protein
VANEREMIDRVASTPGALGYASSVPSDAGVRSIEVR